MRRRRLLLMIAAAIGLSAVCCVGTAAAFFLGGLNSTAASKVVALGCGGVNVDPNAPLPSVDLLTDAQTRNAAVIVSVGQKLKVPPRGWVVAIATALQESNLYDLPNLGARNDHDSLGLFQQRPSTGWGTPQQLVDPVYSATKFYQKLMTVSGWQSLPLTEAAQNVQHSAFPDAYARHEPLATAVVNKLTNGAGRAIGFAANLSCDAGGAQVAASGWTNPVPGARIVSGFRPPSRPTHNGVDLAIAKGTAIHAAAAGIVTVVACQATLGGAPYGCDRDGSSAVFGCGWYVEIRHALGIITRYCHMLRQPDVSVGEQVAAGQPIGVVGDSGNADGFHLHFEVHVNGDDGAAGAIDPVPFMNQQGAPVGAPT